MKLSSSEFWDVNGFGVTFVRLYIEAGKTDWFQIGKEVRQVCILSPSLFNFYAEYIMRKARLEEAQAGIKNAGRNMNNLRYEMIPPLWQKVRRN